MGSARRQYVYCAAGVMLALAAVCFVLPIRALHEGPADGRRRFDASLGVLYRGNPDRREIALTIDDGPHDPQTAQILDILRRENVRATFFVVGSRVKEHPGLIRRMAAEGHEVGNHSQNHYRLDTLTPSQVSAEIASCEINVKRAAGIDMRVMRPPGSRANEAVYRVSRENGYVVASWTAAAKDFDDVPADYIVNQIVRQAENGSIILLHDQRPSTVTALPRMIAQLKRDGFEFVTVSEMLSRLPEAMNP